MQFTICNQCFLQHRTCSGGFISIHSWSILHSLLLSCAVQGSSLNISLYVYSQLPATFSHFTSHRLVCVRLLEKDPNLTQGLWSLPTLFDSWLIWPAELTGKPKESTDGWREQVVGKCCVVLKLWWGGGKQSASFQLHHQLWVFIKLTKTGRDKNSSERVKSLLCFLMTVAFTVSSGYSLRAELCWFCVMAWGEK